MVRSLLHKAIESWVTHWVQQRHAITLLGFASTLTRRARPCMGSTSEIRCPNHMISVLPAIIDARLAARGLLLGARLHTHASKPDSMPIVSMHAQGNATGLAFIAQMGLDHASKEPTYADSVRA